MLKSRTELYNYILDSTISLVTKQNYDDLLGEFEDYIYEKHNIPSSIISELISRRVEEVEATTDKNVVVLFCVTEAIYALGYGKHDVDYFFTEIEIARLSDFKYKDEKIKFPLEIPMIEIKPDQWVGHITAQKLMQWSEAGLIKYNPNTQRALRKKILGENVEYRVDINQVAIKGIRKMYNNNTYIPNDVILNIGDNSEGEFFYDPERKILKINDIDHFDMIDGYNRFYAMAQEWRANHDFDTNFVLQIMNFPEEKAQQYIFQQDLKIKMKPMDVANMNKEAPENKVVERLNNPYSSCMLKGKIGRNDSQINGPELANAIGQIYFHDKKTKDVSNYNIIDAAKEIGGKTNILMECEVDVPDMLSTYKRMLAYIFCLKHSNNVEGDKEKIINVVDHAEEIDLPKNRIRLKINTLANLKKMFEQS